MVLQKNQFGFTLLPLVAAYDMWTKNHQNDAEGVLLRDIVIIFI
jgi:hypothetical protein